MNLLDKCDSFRALDPSGMIRRVLDLPWQCRDARDRVLRFPPRFDGRGIRHVLVTGMGGSAIGGDVLRALAWKTSKAGISVNRHYTLPAWVGKDTLVVCSSYSGNTEETLSSFAQALRHKARILIITSGGKLGQEARRRRLPCCVLPGGFLPRAAFGYSFATLLTALETMGLLPSYEGDFREAVSWMERMSLALGPRVPVKRNEAKRLATFLFGRLPVLYAGQDHLEAVASRWKGQLNENAKQLALVNVLPEMNHNEVEGYAGAEPLSRRMAVLFLRHPQGDHPRVKRRFDVLKPLLAKRTAGVKEVRAEGRSVLAQMLTTLYLGDLVSVYLAYLKRVDPSAMTVIDRIKSSLAKR